MYFRGCDSAVTELAFDILGMRASDVRVRVDFETALMVYLGVCMFWYGTLGLHVRWLALNVTLDIQLTEPCMYNVMRRPLSAKVTITYRMRFLMLRK